VRTAIADARLEGAPQFVAERAAREGANNASYSLFASRASNPMANTYTPSMAAAETSGSLEAGRGLANNSTQNRLQALNSNSQSLMQGSNAAAMARLAALSGNTQNLMQAYGGGSQAVQQAISNGMNIRAPNMQFAEDRTPVAIAGIGSAFMGAGSLYNQYQKRNAGGSSTFGDPVMEQARLMRGNPT
jgi:hypothetical protein